LRRRPRSRRIGPNILFFILDDVGMDQMKVFGYGGPTPPRTPNIDAIARAGVGFRNFWTMPECSPSRALVFEGRYPMRTNVFDAILSVDLANSQVSPYETTTPKVLKRRGYESGLFGKFHLTGSDVNEANNPLGYTAVHQLGWDFFAGWQDGAPHPIDATAGGVAATGVSYPCGFVPNATDDPANGADSGACYFVDQSCAQIAASPALPTPGRVCLERGGVFAPKADVRHPDSRGREFHFAERLLRRSTRHQPSRRLVHRHAAAGPFGRRTRLPVDHRKRPGHRVDQDASARNAVDGHGLLFLGPYALPGAADVAAAGRVAAHRRVRLPCQRGGPARAQQPDDRSDGQRDRSRAGGNGHGHAGGVPASWFSIRSTPTR
jgi:hypothetical protein